MKALAKKRDERYQSADEMLADLREAHAALGEEDSLRTQRLIPHKTAHSSAFMTIQNTLKRPRLSLGLLLIILAVAGLSVWVFMRWRTPAQYKPTEAAKPANAVARLLGRANVGSGTSIAVT